MPRLKASGVPRGATYRALVELSSDLIPGADPVYATFLSLTSAGEVEDDYAEDLPRGEQPVPVVEVERTSVPDSSPSVPPPTAPAPPETAGPSSMSQERPEHIPTTSRDLLDVMDAVRALTTTTASLAVAQTTLAERMARVEVTLAQNQAILIHIQSHLGLLPVTVTKPIQPTTHDQSAVSASAASLDVLAAAAAASDPPASTPPAE